VLSVSDNYVSCYRREVPVLHLLSGLSSRTGDKREIWHTQISPLSGQKCGNTAPESVKISNFGHKCAF